MYALLTSPKSLRSSIIFFTMFDGIAKPYPVYDPVLEWIAVFIPTRSPSVFTRAPPEFPGFIAASVWINASIPPSFKIFISLDLALTIPAVTVELRLNGFPTAKTHWPIFYSFEFANSKYFNLLASIFSKARSLFGSVPNISAV